MIFLNVIYFFYILYIFFYILYTFYKYGIYSKELLSYKVTLNNSL